MWLCVHKLCVGKLCVSKLCEDKLCVHKLCVDKCVEHAQNEASCRGHGNWLRATVHVVVASPPGFSKGPARTMACTQLSLLGPWLQLHDVYNYICMHLCQHVAGMCSM